ncbi:diaminopropionate ammonia-lyase [Deinococcus psychrotolerans]|uniref:Diaminopropionate ammonia-lyase n=1 Tax=Deinococcus psychrotolerans TaxID=2489213 RepID=A0A3G8YJ82_9DEIO|nr:diaminopropionate ammonia-lyase [Deinococcus psychrotolerans]AZI42614.1 diaminopropionate ammonia-lyase [Deinococcus psychrotolerans]
MMQPDAAARIFVNPRPQTFETPTQTGLSDFHRKLPLYAPTPLVSAPYVAAVLGVRQVWVKDESSRLGLPAYKILGAAWATYKELETRFGPFQPWETLSELRGQLPPVTLVAATDGNHGRAVARMAHWLELGAQILVPSDMAAARQNAIRSEGADVEVVDGSYDQAVSAAAKLADDTHLVISDTAWEGYQRVPAWVIAGYGTIFGEIDQQLAALGAGQPSAVAAQMGVGSLAAAVIQHYRAAESTHVLGVEPTQADCVLRSLEAGQLTEVAGPHRSIMAGLNCGNTSPLAWPLLQGGLSASVAVPDARAEDAMRLLAASGVVSGESGAAGLAGFLELLSGRHPAAAAALSLTQDSSLLIISTEGATDPETYRRIVG